MLVIVELNVEEQDPLCGFLFDDLRLQQDQDSEAVQLVEEIKELNKVSLLVAKTIICRKVFCQGLLTLKFIC